MLGYKSPSWTLLQHLNTLNNKLYSNPNILISDRTLQITMLFSALRKNQTITSSTRSSCALNNRYMGILFSLSQQQVTGCLELWCQNLERSRKAYKPSALGSHTGSMSFCFLILYWFTPSSHLWWVVFWMVSCLVWQGFQFPAAPRSHYSYWTVGYFPALEELCDLAATSWLIKARKWSMQNT